MEDDTHSLTASIIDYEYENGRRYHAYHAGKYPLPNDEKEQDRLDLQHHLYLLIYEGDLYRAPLPSNGIRSALDIGCGTGTWAMDFANMHPETHIIALDLSPIQPTYVPENLHFEVDDVEEDWYFGRSFDYIHIRGMDGAIADWPRLLQQAYDNLAPGGWIEIFDNEAQWLTDDGSLPDTSAYHQYLELLHEAAASFGKPLNVSRRYREMLGNAGFTSIRDDSRKVPLSPWHSDPKMIELGHYMQMGMREALEPYVLATATRTSDWNYTQVQVLLAAVRQDLANLNHHIYTIAHCVYAQKPPSQPPAPSTSRNPRRNDTSR